MRDVQRWLDSPAGQQWLNDHHYRLMDWHTWAKLKNDDGELRMRVSPSQVREHEMQEFEEMRRRAHP